MKYETTIKRLEKAGFAVVREIRDSKYNPGIQYEVGFEARKPGCDRRIEATKQDDEVCTMRVIRDNDHDDLHSDYFAGVWVDTVKRALELTKS